MGWTILARAAAVSLAMLPGPSWAGGGFHGGGFHAVVPRPAFVGPRGFGGGGWRGGVRPIPPVAGVIHERPGSRPSYSYFGHTATAYRGGAWARGYGVMPRSGAGNVRPNGWGYGHVATGFSRYGRGRYAGRWERGRFVGRRVAVFRYGRGYLGYGGGYPGYGVDGGSYTVGGAAYPSDNGYGGAPSTYGAPSGYGSYGTQAGAGGAYLSEPPLAATRVEAPLAPSPYGADDGYYAPGGSGTAPHIVTVDRSASSGCACRPARSAYPTIYRYGVGTAY